MNYKLLTVLLFVLPCCYTKEDVVTLTDSDFDSKIKDYESALVMFYAPWCGHCKKLKPEFAKAAEDLLKNDPPITLVKIDCTEGGKETCNRFSVGGYPTLKIFRSGEFSQEYNGPRQADGIVKYMRSQVGPSSKEITSNEELDKFLKSENDVAVIGFFEKESDLKTAFLKVADKLREKVRFAHSLHKDVLKSQGQMNGIVLFRPPHLSNKFEDDSVTYDGDTDVTSITDFIVNNYHGLTGHRKQDNIQEFRNPLVVAYYSVDYVKNPKGTNYWRNRILKVAKQYKGKINFAVSDKDEFQRELNEFGHDYIKGDKPVIFARDIKNQKFVMKDEFSVESLQKFLDSLLNGDLEPYLKSEPIPEKNDDPVKVAVAKNFEELVNKNDKDILIEFYAPWCGHCKKLAPTFDELGKKMENEDVEIVKMDATANDVPADFEVRGFPTLFWIPKNDKSSPVRYEGGRELDDFIQYIAKHASSELKGYDRSGKLKKTEL